MGITKLDVNTMDFLNDEILGKRFYEEDENIEELLRNCYPCYKVQYEYILKLLRKSEKVLYEIMVENEHMAVDSELEYRISLYDNKPEFEETTELDFNDSNNSMFEMEENEMVKYQELKYMLYEILQKIKGEPETTVDNLFT